MARRCLPASPTQEARREPRDRHRASDKLTKEITVNSEALAAVRGRLQDAIRDLVLDEPAPAAH
jgi:hypothetical protein